MKEGLDFFTDTYLTILALVLFAGFFLALLIRVSVYEKAEIAKFENLPFVDHDNNSNSKPLTAEVSHVG